MLQAGWRGWQAGVRRWAHAIPMPCLLCGGAARGARLCAPCREDLLGDAPPRCRWCALRLASPDDGCLACTLRTPAYDYAIAAIDYAPPGQALVWRAKQSWQGAAARAVADLLAEAVARDARGLPPGCLALAVPASHRALRRRGYNPAARLGRICAAHLGLAWSSTLLRAGADDGLRQHRLGRAQRLERGGARYVAMGVAPGQPIALIDDVMTTGSTVEACARALKAAGAGPVVVLAVARTPAPGAGVPDPS
ncbi:ComF family protein [Verticiella sediminum]|uniref:ComF family protein n=1 Tax=Verticiella sediminum TaxID=1247510 RepID=A0A556A888_9BURK|nr:ComF family protein [Verticiella sediminum]TSH89083.1 ComF family protein [Verticiella sediminum]